MPVTSTDETTKAGRGARPWQLRPGARFACEGDGLCCSDMHALGPVSRTEARRLRVIQPGSVVPHDGLKISMTRVVPHAAGGQVCTFLGPDGGGCGVYEVRPSTCRIFPFGLVETPAGMRVTTEHRCPCRSLGPRPPLDLGHARRALVDAAGRTLRPDGHAGATVVIEGRRRTPFARFVARHETPLLAALLAPEPDPLAALGVAPLPPLAGLTWPDVAHLLRAHDDGSMGDEAIATFGDALLTLAGGSTRARRTRPWAWSFDRAEARGEPTSAARVLGDWAADVLWSLGWSARGDWQLARLELATRVAVAEVITARLTGEGLRPDRAAAEAVMMAELVGSLGLWESVVGAMREAQAP
ncbi:MAG: YkgJ family cysteine cluster protein [Myxococcales bacterium]|nr:MAG: YkgJ family cysteine cluster protein [Myxococcales bacterium]